VNNIWLSLVQKRDFQPAQSFALKEPSQSKPYRARDREQRDKTRGKGEEKEREARQTI
tara:strand:- start:202 stop:375 length:174 start_codon:yes stop_codon:yes gene_type:complete